MKLIEDYKILHEAGAFGGMTLAKFSEPVLKLLKFHGGLTVLDYGSGKGQSWENHDGLRRFKERLPVTLYDPGVLELSTKPIGTFDAVLCFDVVEHIPEDEIETTLAEIFGYAERVVLATFCARGSRKKLPSNGQDVHVTQRPRLFWEELFHAANMAKRRPVPWYLFENV